MAEWQRSTSVEFPRIWSEFTIKNPISNEMQKFTISDIPESIFEQVIKDLIRFGVETAPIEIRAEILADQVSAAEKEEWWRMVLKQRLSLMCYKEQATGMPMIEGFSINIRWSVFDIQPKFKGKEMKWSWAIQKYIYTRKAFYVDFTVAEAIIAANTFTCSEFSAVKVHEEMYKCRAFICQVANIKLCLTCFAITEGENSAVDMAIEAGFHEYAQVPYKDVASFDKTYPLPECKCFLIMTKYYA